MRKVNSFLLITLTMFCCSCNRSQVRTPADLIQYLEEKEHGYVSKIKTGNVVYSIQLATPQYMAAKETADAGNASTLFAQRVKELDGHLFVLLRIESRQNNPGDAERRVSYYAGAAQSDIILRYGDKLLTPVSYHFEDNFGLSPYNTIVVAFATGTKPEDAALVFNDRYAGNPMIRASFSAEQISNIPAIK